MIANYIKERYKIILILAVNLIILSVTLILYNTGLEGIIYGNILSLTVTLIIGIFDFFIYKEKVLKIKDKLENIDIEYEEENLRYIDNLYMEKIKKLSYENKKLDNLNEKNRKEIMDYYILWVHQIKTPIASLNLISNNLEGEVKGEVLGEVFKIEEYVNMALTYVRLTEGESDLVIKRHSLDKLLKIAIKKYARLFIRKGIALEFKASNLEIITDEKWFLFGIDQILSNSIKYTKKGKITIYVEKNNVVIEDTGIGIDKADLKRIFNKGFTGFNGRSNKKATGLGLYLAQNSFYKVGSKIEIKSEVDKYTKVIISLNI